MNFRSHFNRRSGYTLIEVLVASGLIASALAAASALSLSMAKQEEIARNQSAAIRYGEAVARLWQLGVNPSTFLLAQPEGLQDTNNITGMSFTIIPGTPVDLGDDGGIAEGTAETAAVTVTWHPFGSSTASSLSFDVLRPAPAHR